MRIKHALALTALLAGSAAAVSPAIASNHGDDKPGVCHPVGSDTGGNQHNGYSLISPSQASSHIDESQYPDGHYWKHEHDGRHDVYATDGLCPGSTPPPSETPTSTPTPTDTPTPTPTETPTSTPTEPTPTEPPTSTPTAHPHRPKHAHIRVVVVDRCRCKHDSVRVYGRHLAKKTVHQHRNRWTIRVVAQPGWAVPTRLGGHRYAHAATYHLRTTNKPCPCQRKHTCHPHPHPTPPPCHCKHD